MKERNLLLRTYNGQIWNSLGKASLKNFGKLAFPKGSKSIPKKHIWKGKAVQHREDK